MRASRHCNRLPAAPSRFFRTAVSIPAFIDSALVKPRASLTGLAAIRQLAEDFRQGFGREGGVSRDDLQTLGWTGQQLDDHGAAAIVQAQRLAGATL